MKHYNAIEQSNVNTALEYRHCVLEYAPEDGVLRGGCKRSYL